MQIAIQINNDNNKNILVVVSTDHLGFSESIDLLVETLCNEGFG